jgi:DNA-binding Lrp family transcriptional regulator
MAVELDDVDIQLLTALQQDADRTNVELARLAGCRRPPPRTGSGG